MATDPQQPQPDGPLTMGLKGLWLQIAQIGAVGLICLMFYQDRHESLKTAAEDRKMFREELRAQRRSLDKLSHAVESLAEEQRRSGKGGAR